MKCADPGMTAPSFSLTVLLTSLIYSKGKWLKYRMKYVTRAIERTTPVVPAGARFESPAGARFAPNDSDELKDTVKECVFSSVCFMQI